MSASPTPITDPSHSQEIAPETWLERNLRSVVLFVALAILATIAYGVIWYRTEALTREAGEAFASSDTVEELDAVISKYPKTPAAGNALLLKANLLWENNQKDSSLDALRTFITLHDAHPLLPTALLSLATRLDALGESVEAEQRLRQVATEFSSSEFAPLAELRLADLLWSAGKTDEAREIYESLPAKYPGTNQPFFDQTQDRLKWLGAALPTSEVEPPPPPPTPPADPNATPSTPLPPIRLDSDGLGTITTPNTVPPLKPVEPNSDPKTEPASAAPPPPKVTPELESEVETSAVAPQSKPAPSEAVDRSK